MLHFGITIVCIEKVFNLSIIDLKHKLIYRENRSREQVMYPWLSIQGEIIETKNIYVIISKI